MLVMPQGEARHVRFGLGSQQFGIVSGTLMLTVERRNGF